MPDTDKKPAPPYVAYKTLKNFLGKFKQVTPSRIDRDQMGSMSGAAQSQVTTALKFLGLISEQNLTQDAMKRLAASEGETYKKQLQDILRKHYAFVFSDSLDLTNATASQLREAFAANTSATGETLERCIVFFKEAAADAGINLSPFIMQRRSRTKSNGSSRKRAARSSDNSDDGQNQGSNPPPIPPQQQRQPIEAESSLLLWGLFQRLPKPGTIWPYEQRKQWTDTLNNILALEYKEQ